MRKIFTVPAVILALALAACGDMPMQPEPAGPAAARAPVAGPGDATAASALTVSSLQCYDLGGGGIYYNLTSCSAWASGGTPGYTFTWDVIVTSEDPNSSYIEGVCTDSYPVTVTVRDAAGAVASKSETFDCYAKSPGNGSGLEP
ncbi:MAG TPA: hypothetical protein VHG51_04670 [Longimicrobiaceae bacterium]|nr:hypothetical protein [Longimicrobiaceae bacterium]